MPWARTVFNAVRPAPPTVLSGLVDYSCVYCKGTGVRQGQKTYVFGVVLMIIAVGLAVGIVYRTGLLDSDSPRESKHGVNLAGAEFGEHELPGVFQEDYIYPSVADLDYFASKGIQFFRLPFLWERLQRCLNCELDGDELARIRAFMRAADERQMLVILSPHNYARYNQQLIGTDDVPVEAFRDFWERVARAFRDEPGVWAYGLMNEPHGTGGTWPSIAQAGVDGIRLVDDDTTILVPGDAWSNAWTWRLYNGDLAVDDPADNVIYEAHVYFDISGSGEYFLGYDGEAAHPDIGVQRVQPFLDWLEQHGHRGFIGEYGVPGDDPRWLEVMDRFLAHLVASGVSSTYWAAGPWWGEYPLAITPINGEDRPQMSILEEYVSTQ